MSEFKEIVYPDKTKYQGYVKNGKRHGKGKFTWNSGAYYDGDFVEDVMEGNGLLVFQDKSTYKGLWKNNLRQGEGI